MHFWFTDASGARGGRGAGVFQETMELRELTPAEFDALHATDPGVRDGGFRRLRAAIGDARGGEEYL